MRKSKYVIKNDRLKTFLFTLGFDYTRQKDITGKQCFVWLFDDTESLQKAIRFYTKYHQKQSIKTSKNFEVDKSYTSK